MKIFSSVIVLLALLTVIAGCGTAVKLEQTVKPEGQTRMVIDFENASLWMSENDSPFAVGTTHVSQGKGSLKVTYTNKPEWSNVLTTKVPVTDWTSFNFLNIDLFLEGDQPAELGVWVRDKKQHKATEHFPIGPGWNTVSMDLDKMVRTAGFERNEIISLCIYKASADEMTAHLDNMYISEKAPVIPEKAPVETSSDELITNGGFEELGEADSLGSPFTWWHARRWSGASFIGRGTEAMLNGTSSLMLDGRDNCKIGFFSPPIKVTSPTLLQLTAHFASQGLTKAGAAIILTDHAEKSLPDGVFKVTAGDHDWTRVTMVCKVPANCPEVKVFVQLYSKGLFWIDDVSLTGVSLETEPSIVTADAGKALTADKPVVTETPVLTTRKNKALNAAAALKALADRAREQGIETLYDEIPLVLADLAFNVRWDHPDHLGLRDGYITEVFSRCDAAVKHLGAVLNGQLAALKVPPHPAVADLALKDAYYCKDDAPQILFSMQYHRNDDLIRWFYPGSYYFGLSAVGGNRYNFKQTPVWEAYQKYPETHRVYDNGWCGHIIRDQYSAGGEDQCVISLDSPKMLEAIRKSHMEYYAPRFAKAKDNLLVVNMGFEYAYRNYDSYSEAKFRNWLMEQYGTIAKLNEVWKTDHAAFTDIDVPSYAPGAVEPNPAKRYDWGAFNLWRFTDYMVWAKAGMKEFIGDMPTTTGGGMPFGAHFWSDGLDEEELDARGVTDIWLSETGSRALGVTSVMDLQRSLHPGKLIIDPEYHAQPNTCFLMFLHGCGMMDYWWWPNEADSGFYASSLKHSHLLTLPAVETVLRTALDVRRLARYIVPFPAAPPEIALLYSRASLIQKHPGAEGHQTPYSMEVEKTYQAAVRLDTPVGFASSKQIVQGGLDRYKVLVVPGARYVKPEVFEAVRAWTEKGGTVVITPTSLIADQYSRRQNYLADLGITITGEEVPEFMAGEAQRGIDQEPGELDFIQGPVAKTVVSKEPAADIKTADEDILKGYQGTFKAAGVLQSIEASDAWQAIAAYDDSGKSAILMRTLGKGKVYYLAAQLDVTGRRVFLDRLMTLTGFERPVRAMTPDGSYPEGVESRTVAFENGLLTYLHNTNDKAMEIDLKTQAKVKTITWLNTETVIEGLRLTLAPFETRILMIEIEK